MAAALLKDLFGDTLLRQLSEQIRLQQPHFDQAAFIAAVLTPAYGQMALKQRVRHIATTLYQHIDLPFAECCQLLRPVSERITGLPGLIFPDIVEQFGLDDFATAMQALGHFTCGSTSEFAIRPFLLRYPDQTLAQLAHWSQSDNYHQRRLASEGCRPRLPWGCALPVYKRDPTPLLPILTTLRQDSAEYVRRSVANNLNDISKDHPALVLQLAKEWLGVHPDTDRLVRHALRGLLKARHPTALVLFDCQPRQLKAQLQLASAVVQYGETLQFCATLELLDGPAPLRLEYAIDFVGKSGQPRHKVFQWLNKNSGPARLEIKKSYRFVDLTTRTHYAGPHQISLIVNGQVVATQSFQLIRHNQ